MKGCYFGEELILLGSLLSFEIAKGKTVEELALLAAFFTVLGDNLALLTTTRTGLTAVEE